MSSLPAIFAEGCAACVFSVGFGSTGPAGDPSLPLLDVEQFWTCVHVKEVTLESGKLNQSLWTPPPLCQPIENHRCAIRIFSGSSLGLLHLIETTHVEWQDMKDRINVNKIKTNHNTAWCSYQNMALLFWMVSETEGLGVAGRPGRGLSMVYGPGRGTSSLWQVLETHTESCWTFTLYYISKLRYLKKEREKQVEHWSTNIRLR